MDHDHDHDTHTPVPGTAEGDAALLAAHRDGDETAFGRLYDAWFDRAYDVALRIVREPDTAADVAQDAFVSAWRNLDDLDDRQAFGGWLLRITRNRALDHKRKHDRTRPVDDEVMAVIEVSHAGARAAGGDPEGRLATATDPARAVEDAELAALVWEAADALGERDASLLDLHLRHGLAPAEIAEELGVEPNAAHQSLHRLRDRLGAAVAARILWRGGVPTCPVLAQLLDDAGGPAFDGDTAGRIRRHAKSCEECTGRQRTQLEPSKLFAAVPVAVAPVALKAKAAAAMEGTGVPMSGSEHLPGGPAGSGPGATLGHRLLIALLVIAVVLLSIGAVLALTARSLDDDPRVVPDPTTTAVTSTTALTDVPPPSDGPAPPPAPPAPDQPPVPTGPRIVNFALTPTAVPPESTPPTIVWAVDPAGTGTAELTGPNLFTTALNGSQVVCPGAITSGVCVAEPGSYDYTLHADDGTGAAVDVRTITLLVG